MDGNAASARREPDEVSMKFSQYEMRFPIYLVTGAVVVYFNWLGLGLANLSGHRLLQIFALIGVFLFLHVLRYRPTFMSISRTTQQARRFVYLGQGYVEAVVFGVFAWGLNKVPCSPWIKLFVFLAAVPIVDFLMTKGAMKSTSEVLHYPDINRP